MNADAVFLQKIRKEVSLLAKKKIQGNKENLRREFLVVYNHVFDTFWAYLAFREKDIARYICRDLFISMRMRHASEMVVAMEKEAWVDLKSRLLSHIFEVYEAVRNYLQK